MPAQYNNCLALLKTGLKQDLEREALSSMIPLNEKTIPHQTMERASDIPNTFPFLLKPRKAQITPSLSLLSVF